MRTVAIINAKGGTGKTTTTATLARIFSQKYGKKVLLMDCDTQHNLTTQMGCDESDEMKNLLSGWVASPWTETKLEGVKITPSGYSLYEMELAGALGKNGDDNGYTINAIEMKVELAAENGAGDICLIDCPPHFTTASVAALVAADTILIPTTADGYSASGMKHLLQQVRNLKGDANALEEGGIFGTMWENKPIHREVEDALRGNGWTVLKAHIRRSPKALETTWASGESLMDYSPRSAAAKDYEALATELAEKWGWIK